MKQLAKFKTQYDHQANYDRSAFTQAKKDLYHTEIELTTAMAHKAHIEFKMQPLDVTFLQSLTLKDDPKFISIQRTFERYNEDVAAMAVNPQEGMHLKKVVMESMLKFMRVMMLSPSAHSKKVILDMSYYWLSKHLNPKNLRKTPEQLNTDIRQILIQHELAPRSVIEQQLPSSKVAAYLKEYRRGARTQHHELDAPEHQLHQYQLHKVTYLTQNMEPPENEGERWKRKLLKIKYDRPNLEQYYQQEDKPEGTGIDPVDPDAVEAEHPIGAISGEGGAISGPIGAVGEGRAVVPQIGETGPIAMNSELARQMELLNQMGGDPDQGQEAVVEEEEDRRRGKLDPLVKIFLRKQLAEKERERDASCEHPPVNQFERYRNNYRQAVQREEEYFSTYMNDWAAKRSRLKTEVARKVQSIRIPIPHNSTLQSMQGHNNTLQHSSTFQQNAGNRDPFHESRVSEAIRDGRKYIKGELNREGLNSEEGLSCFDRRRVKTIASTSKPFTTILEDHRRGCRREEYLIEIEGIKQKFAKNKIYTSMNAMKGGLMQEEGDGEDERGEVRTACPVFLPSNPFFVGKKKKKKGKKRR